MAWPTRWDVKAVVIAVSIIFIVIFAGYVQAKG
jgi:hypothetical protein